MDAAVSHARRLPCARGTLLAQAGSAVRAIAANDDRAEAAGLNYGTDSGKGIRRVRAGAGFRYLSPTGRPVRGAATLGRIRSLAIPPAWTGVWISPDPKAHLQATGRDARGRKQYRYHSRWKEVSHQTKYSRMVPFARALPGIRRRVTQDLRRASLCREKVVAVVVQLLEKTLIRVGNVEYARANGSFGLTTLRDQHVKIRGGALRFEFKGKSGITHAVTVSDARLAKLVGKCQDLPGQELFQYVDDDDERRPITSADVNGYLREAAGDDFSAKDFRTWAGTILAAQQLRNEQPGSSERKTKSVLVQAVQAVAQQLGNTPTVCRTCYIHPAILEAFADGSLRQRLATRRRRRGLSPDECAVLAVLESQRDWRAQLAESARVARAA
jgi:DNA topoisomerase-1